MDPLVLQTQEWLNETYKDVEGYETIPENGNTGWTTVFALTRALQHELGITELSDNFGPQTESLFQPLVASDYQTESNMMYILQGALWCKGIPPGSWTGVFDESTVQTVKNFQADAGLTDLDGIVTTDIMKALLNMSAFVLVANGDSRIRDIQQSLNSNYRQYTGLLACDGVYERETNTALIYALQAEEGLGLGVANGFFGDGTTSLCPTLSVGDTRKNFVLILQYALYINKHYTGGFDGVYGSAVEEAVRSYQEFMVLPVTGIANMTTIKQLLSSAGDPNRDALACDTATILTETTAQALKRAEFDYVGRYLTGNVGDGSGGVKSKALTREELGHIFDAGLKIFPIYEDGGFALDYFNADQGSSDAQAAMSKALELGIPKGTMIFFAVDFDALDVDITNNVLPYFEAVKHGFDVNFDNQIPQYRIGVYGPRNVCTQVCNAGYAELSYAADMSTGWSGNLGFTMPDNWAYDQFSTITVGNATLGFVEVDMVAFSGADQPFAQIIDAPTEAEEQALRLSKFKEFQADIPILNDFDTTTLELDKEISLREDRITVTLVATGQLTFPGSQYSAISVKNGQIAQTFTDGFNIFQAELGLADNYQSALKSIAAKVGEGNIYVKYSFTPETVSVEFMTQQNLISNDIYSVGLQISLVYSIDNRPPQDGDPVTIPDTQPLFDWALAEHILFSPGTVIAVIVVATIFTGAGAGAAAFGSIVIAITGLLSKISGN